MQRYSLSIIWKYNIKHLLLLLVLFVSSQQTLKADHLMGADMSYVCLGSGKYKIIIKYYRDCRGASSPLNWNQLYWYAGNNLGMSTSKYSIEMTRIGIRDITPRCSTASSPCSPTNTSYTGEGVEEHTYEASIDISKAPFTGLGIGSTYCELTFAYNQCCRNAAITTGATWSDFWTTATINICNVNKSKNKCNSSPTFSNVPIGYICCNQAFYHNSGAIDTADSDSLSYNLTWGISSIPNTSINYSSPFSARHFMTPYCIPATTIKCNPNPLSNPPKGLYFDTMNGDLIFTPTKCDEVGVGVIEITEWRKDSATNTYLVIGRNRREMEFIVKDNCGYNKSPTLSGPFNWNVCEGDTLKFKVETDDETYSPYQSVPDTTTIEWNRGIPSATFKVANKSTWPEQRKAWAYFEWTPTVGMASDIEYTFTVTTSDGHCPKPSNTIRAYKIRVLPKPLTCDFAAIQENVNGNYGLVINPIDKSNKKGGQNGVKYSWVVKDVGTKFTQDSNATVKFNLPNDSTYSVTMVAESTITGCKCSTTRNVSVNKADLEVLNNKVKIYPNPAKDRLIFETTFKNYPVKYLILNIQGQQIGKGTILESGQNTIAIDNYHPGFYLVKLIRNPDSQPDEIENLFEYFFIVNK